MLPVIFFIISLMLMSGFLFMKVRRFNAGHIEHHFPHILESVREDIMTLKETLQHHAKKTFKKTIFTLGKTWVIVVYLSEKRLRKHFPKLFPEEQNPNQKPSFFISTIMEYKMRMKHFKKKIREEDEKQEDETGDE